MLICATCGHRLYERGPDGQMYCTNCPQRMADLWARMGRTTGHATSIPKTTTTAADTEETR